MADIDLSTLTYDKGTIDSKIADERSYVNTALPLKVDVSSIGGANGIMQLTNNKVDSAFLPFSTLQEVIDGTATDTIVTPATLNNKLSTLASFYVLLSSAGAPLGYAPLDSQAKISQQYLPATPNVATYVVATLAARDALVGILEGDRVVVSADPSDVGGSVNGEYVASSDNPTATDWDKLPNLSAVQSVNGLTGNVTLTSIAESAQNKIDIATKANSTDVYIKSATYSTIEADALLDTKATVTSVDANTTEIGTRPAGEAGSLWANVGNSDGSTTNSLWSTVTQLVTDVSNVIADTLANTTWISSRTYDFSNYVNVVVPTTSYTPIGTLSATRDAGTYEIKFSSIWTYNSASRSANFRWSIDGGVTWIEYIAEPADATNIEHKTYVKPYVHTGGPFTIDIEARKESVADDFIVHSLDIVLERKV